MARVTATEVKAIMENCVLDDLVVDVFIEAANEVVTQTLAGTTVGTVLLKSIERFYTAHMIAGTLHRTTSEEKLGDAAVVYTGKWDKNLDSTPYGQIVKGLDTSGKMASLGSREASIYVITSFE